MPEPLPHDPAAAVPLAQHLLDEGRPFQAHEVLEELWRSAPEDLRPLWQGLAQLAVAITHSARGNREGARRLLQRAASRLNGIAQSAPAPVDGTAVAEWLNAALTTDPPDDALARPLRLARDTTA